MARASAGVTSAPRAGPGSRPASIVARAPATIVRMILGTPGTTTRISRSGLRLTLHPLDERVHLGVVGEDVDGRHGLQDVDDPPDRRLQMGDRHPAASGLQRFSRLDEDADPRAADVLEASHVEDERGRGLQDELETLVENRRGLGVEAPTEGDAAAPVPHLGDLDLEPHGPGEGYASTRPAPSQAGDARGLALRGPGSTSARAEPPPPRRDGVAPGPRAARNAVPRTLRARIGSDRGYPGRDPSGAPRTGAPGAPGAPAPRACRGAVRRAPGRRGARQRWLRVRGHLETPAVGRRRGVPPRSGAHGRPSPGPARPRPAPRPAPLAPPARGDRQPRRPPG